MLENKQKWELGVNSRRLEKKPKKEIRLEKKNWLVIFFDLSKLSFAGLVIGIIIPLYANFLDENNWYIAVTGIVLTTLSALLANKILK